MSLTRFVLSAAVCLTTAAAFAQSNVRFAQDSYDLQFEGRSVQIRILRSGNLSESFELAFSVQDPAGRGNGGCCIHFNPGDTFATFFAGVNDDAIVGNNRVATLEVSYRSGTRPVFPGGAATMTVPLNVHDDDVPANVAVNDLTVREGDSGPHNADVTVTFAPYKWDWEVTLQTADLSARAGQDYTAKTQFYYVLANATSLTLPVPISGDGDYESNETFTVRLLNPTRLDVLKTLATVTIENDDPG